MATKRKLKPLRGTVEVVGDKSITHRALILSALAAGRARLTNLNDGTDCAATRAALESFGVPVATDGDPTVAVVEGGRLREPDDVIDCGNSGSTIRMLLGVAAGVEGVTVLTGDDSLRGRPMLRVVAPLRQMGATIDGRAHADRAPLTIRGGALIGLDYEMPIPSAQVKTALLLAGLQARGTTVITSPGPSRDHTERMLRAMGAGIEDDPRRVELSPGALLEAIDRRIPGDLSAALFLIVGALIVPGSEITVAGVGLNPTRTAILDVLTSMGADLSVTAEQEVAGEPVGSVTARSSELRGVSLGPDDVAAAIDEIPILAIAAAAAEGRTEIRGAGELRAKESDRIRTITDMLRVFDAPVDPYDDGFAVTGRAAFSGGRVDSHGDHRIAMAATIGGLVASSPVTVTGWSCVDSSFPGFLDVLGRAQGRGTRRTAR